LKALAIDVFKSEEAAHDWLARPHPILGDSPSAAAATPAGAQRVRDVLVMLKYGGVA
jgi:putative toxin-antitoxin system antitoxin component (TIGR02293 family)